MTDNFDKLKKLRSTSALNLLDSETPSTSDSKKLDKNLNSKANQASILKKWRSLLLKLKRPNKSQVLIFALSFLFLSLCWTGFYGYLESEAAKNPKVWPVNELTMFGKTKANLKTSFKNGQVYYHLLISPITQKLKGAMEKHPFSTNKGFGVDLYDKDGFKVYSNSMNLNEFTQLVDDNGKLEAYDINSSRVLKKSLEGRGFSEDNQ